MIAIHDIDNLNFKCEYCGQPFNQFSMNIAILLYGVAFLSKDKDAYNQGYVVITCPGCMKNILIKCEDLSGLYKSIITIVGPDGIKQDAELWYSSLRPELKNKEIAKITYAENIFEEDRDVSELSNFQQLDRAMGITRELPDQNLLSSYSIRFGVPLNYYGRRHGNQWPVVLVAWVKLDELKKLVDLENSEKNNLIPRYYYKSDWLKRINDFCWNHYLFDRHAVDWREVEESYDGVEFLDPSEIFDTDENGQLTDDSLGLVLDAKIEKANDPAPEFLEILRDDSTPWQKMDNAINQYYEDVWKTPLPYYDKSMPTGPSEYDIKAFKNDRQENIRRRYLQKISKYSDEPFVSHFLSDNYLGFIKEYLEAIQQQGFSYGVLWNLKLNYMERLAETINKGLVLNCPYALYKEGPTWTMIFNGKAIRGLRNKGFLYIAYLIDKKKEQVKIMELAKLDKSELIEKKPDHEAFSYDSGFENIIIEKIDHKAKALLDDEKKRLEQTLEEAEQTHDTMLINGAQAKLDEFMKYYFEAVGYKGKQKLLADSGKKAKEKITKSIERAIKELEKHDSEAFNHFEKAIKPVNTYKPMYYPVPDIDWIT